MTWLSDSTELIPGGWLSSAYMGHGILGADAPTTGEHGASVLFNDLTDLPADLARELRFFLVSEPPGLTTFVMGEDGSIIATAPNGTYIGTGRLYADGADRGTTTFTLIFGNVVTAAMLEALSLVDQDDAVLIIDSAVMEAMAAVDGMTGLGPFIRPAMRVVVINVSGARRGSNLARS